MKLVLNERETPALITFLTARPSWVSSAVAKVELLRAVGRSGSSLVAAREVMDRVALIPVDDDVLERATLIAPPTVRALDAIHAATCLRLRERLAAVITYDTRLASALTHLGIRVHAPA